MPARLRPIRSAPRTAPRLHLFVVFTDLPHTRAALQHAQSLSRDLHADITLLALQQVPYPLPLEEPPIRASFLARQLNALAGDPGIRIQLCCTRDAASVWTQLPPGAIFVIGTGSWLHRKFHKLAAQLTHSGYAVVQIEHA